MKRRLFTLCSAVSLLLCIGVCVLWVRSRRHFDSVQWVSGGRGVSLTSVFGCVEFEITRPPLNIDRADGAFVSREVGDVPATTRQRFAPTLNEWGARRLNYTVNFGPPSVMRVAGVRVRTAILAALFAVLPVSRLAYSFNDRRRRIAGLCRSCGYDLRASPERCPECGAAAASAGGRPGS